uniref:Ankyrin repeat domain 13A n=1 Tax=Nothobranchius furzeri TaxID=105023 RepID=A0A8C6Q7B6_NOTFU
MANVSEDIREKFPLHSAVWENDFRKLEEELRSLQNEIETMDPRGRTPLHLAVSLGHLETVRVLLRHGAQVTKENAHNWTVLQEAVSTGDPEMVQLVLQRRDYLKASTALGGVPELLLKIRESPDFYMEMKWEFTSWKSCAELMEMNHDDGVVDVERFNISQEVEDVTLESMQPAEQEVAKRLTTPIVNTYLDTKNIAFERSKSGIWGWKTDKTEVVNGFESKVFNVNNVNVVIRTRTEHLTDEEKTRIKSERNVLESLLGTVEQHISAQGDLTLEYATATNPTAITPEEYFDPDFDLGDRDIGRPIELTIRTQKFKGTLWMSEEHPLSLVEQVTPVIDLMARTSSHFARLRDFVTLNFPPGFPVKIEIPLFHVLNARITFGNLNKCRTEKDEEEEVGTSAATTPSSTMEDLVCPSVFEVPASYQRRGGSRHTPAPNNDEELLQYAIHQSLLDSQRGPGQVSTLTDFVYLVDHSFVLHSPASFSCLLGLYASYTPTTSISDSELRLAMELSAQAQEEEERRRKQEEEELERILQLSLTDK